VRFKKLILILPLLVAPLSSAFAESCQQKVERVIEALALSKEVRFHKLSDSAKWYRTQILEKTPALKRKISYSDEPALKRLARLKDNNNPNDVKYLMEKELLKSDYNGGEASIFVGSKSSKEAMKLWNPARMDEFELSTRAVMHYEAIVEKSSKLKRHLSVAKIKELGKNYIVKEFSPKSTELKHMVSDPKVKQIIKDLKRDLSQESNPFNQKLLNALNKKPVSANLHWDPEQGKVLLIDALGF